MFSLRDGLEIMREPRRATEARSARSAAARRRRSGSSSRPTCTARPSTGSRSRRGRRTARRCSATWRPGRSPDVDEATSVVRTLAEVDRARSAARRRLRRRPTRVYRSLYGTLRDDMHRLAALARRSDPRADGRIDGRLPDDRGPGGRDVGPVGRARARVRGSTGSRGCSAPTTTCRSARPHERGALDAWATISALGRDHRTDPARLDGLAGHVPPPRGAREGRS